jgi:hypothetical protein
MMSIPEEYIDSFVTNVMNDKKEIGQYREYAKDQKVFDKIRESVSLETKEVTLEELSKMGE